MGSLFFIDVVAAYLIDLVVGDPYWFPHPVRLIGGLIKKSENFLRRLVGRKEPGLASREKGAGLVLCLFVVGTVTMAVWGLLALAAVIHPVLFHLLNIYFIYSALATQCLALEAKKVYTVLKAGDIEESRRRLAMLVGRETNQLNEQEVIRGVVETTAENTVDGVLSPMIYALVGSVFGFGAPLAYAFKAASTLDSMVGYRNEKYINFGWASARFDDVLNYIPARLSGIILPISAGLMGKNFTRSFRIMLRDRRNHKSPNCAYPEAAVAGALGVRLGGSNVYFGKVVEKPTIGDPDKELEPVDIIDTVKIMMIASLITLLAGLLLCFMIR